MGTVNRKPGRRKYESPVRQQSARRTRQLIATAASRLFVEKGYAATSISEVATAAGVARPTVSAAIGSKPALLKLVLDQALAGDDDPVPVAERSWFAPVWAATNPADVLRAYAGACTLIASRAASMFEVVRRAADVSAELGTLWEAMQRNRRLGAAMVLRHAAETGKIRYAGDRERGIDVLTIYNDPALYGLLVEDRGWSRHQYTAWLADEMCHALVPEAPTKSSLA